MAASQQQKMYKQTVCLLAFWVTILGVLGQECDRTWNEEANKTFYDKKNYYKAQDDDDDVNDDIDSLRLVHVVFRHGDRAPDPDSLYPLDPYYNFTYYPEGLGQLSNLGKKQEFQIGQALRKRYDEFLGSLYIPEVVDARSTDYNRTKMSLELVLAGLWPPVKEQIWNNELPWQPIPYNYLPNNEDRILGDPNIVCPRYKKLYDENLKTSENVIENSDLKSFYRYLDYYTGLNFTSIIDVYNMYFTLRSEEGYGLKLPAWTKCVWPAKFLEVTLMQYDLFTQTPELTGLSAGLLLDKIINDSKSRMLNNPGSSGRKIYLYSSHERNIALTLIGLGVFYPHMPPYASYVLLELHEIDGVYGFKVFYQDYTEEKPRLMTVPGCDSFCPFDKFYNILLPNLPQASCDL